MSHFRVFAVCSILTLGGCFAHAPIVEPVSRNARGVDQHAAKAERVYYALPRTVVVAKVPLVVRSLVSPVVEFDPPKDCSISERMDPAHACYWQIKPAKLDMGDALLRCNSKLAVFPQRQPVPAAFVSIPDANETYSLKISPEAFEKLKMEFALSPFGSPTTFSATSTSLGKEVLDFGSELIKKFGLFDAPGIGPATARASTLPVSAAPQVLARLENLERQRLALLQNPGTTSDVLAAIVAEQARWRRLLEGSIVEQMLEIEIAFDPGNDRDSAPDPLPLKDFAPCGDKAEVSAHLELTEDPASRAFVLTQDSPQARQGNGFRYRVPTFAEGRVALTCKRDPSEAATAEGEVLCEKAGSPEKWLDLSGAVPIAQWGAVRTLPRRLGFGTGAISAAFDPATGGLVKVGTEAEGAGREIFVGLQQEALRDDEMESLKAEVAAAELQVKLCAAYTALGRPLPASCPGAD